MCMVSMIGDDWSRRDKWPNWPQTVPFPDNDPFKFPVTIPENNPSFLKGQIEQLKKQVEQMKRELEEARAQDVRDNNADCEMDEKVIVLKKIAKMFGIELNEVFPNDR